MATCDTLEVDLSRVDYSITLEQYPCIDVEVLQPDITIEAVTVANQGPKGDKGDPGPQGNPGVPGAVGGPGPQGLPGAAATIAVGSTVTGTPGSSATVNNSGSSSAAIFNFSIPAGVQGAVGATGSQGNPGAAATIAVGTTATGAPGSNANVTNSGSSSAAIFNFTIPRGDVGATGSQGATGPQGSVGQTGVNAYTSSTADFTLPAVGSTVSVNVADASWIIVGQFIWVDGGGGTAYAMQVTGKSGNTLTLLNGGQIGVTYPYDLALYANGKPAASALLMRFIFDRTISFPVNLAGSVASVGTAPAAAAAFAVAKNGAAIGTLNFAGAATSGTFSIAAAQSFSSGDVLTIAAPATADAALSDLSVTLSGTRT